MIYIFTGIGQLPDDFLETCSFFLPRWRIDRMMNYRNHSDRLLCAMGYLMLVYGLKKENLFHSLPEFGYHTSGKPFLTNYQGVYFNLSHCRNTVVCMISCQEVGVDVETIEEYDDDLARVICNEFEYQWVTAAENSELKARKLTEIWTRKESLVKYLGTGLNEDIRAMNVWNSQKNGSGNYYISSRYIIETDCYLSVCSNINLQKTDFL